MQISSGDMRPLAKSRKSVRLAWALGSLCLLFLLVCFLAQSSKEPKYGGKRLTYWLRQLSSTNPGERDEADKAVAEMGTEVLPTLLYILDSKDSSFKRIARARGVNWLPVVAPTLKEEAVIAYGQLGIRAAGTMPDLLKIITRDKMQHGEWVNERTSLASRAINEIGYAAIPYMTNAFYLSDSDQRCNVIYALALSGDGVQSAVQVFIDGTSETNSLTRYYCVAMLLQVTNRTGAISNVMQRALNDSDSLVREYAGSYFTNRDANSGK